MIAYHQTLEAILGPLLHWAVDVKQESIKYYSYRPSKYTEGNATHGILCKIKCLEAREHHGIYFCSFLLLRSLHMMDLKMSHNSTNTKPRHSDYLL